MWLKVRAQCLLCFFRCCSASCEFCGGHGCDSITGGAANCCANAITSANQLCSGESGAPCLLNLPVSGAYFDADPTRTRRRCCFMVRTCLLRSYSNVGALSFRLEMVLVGRSATCIRGSCLSSLPSHLAQRRSYTFTK